MYEPVKVGGLGAEIIHFFLRENAKEVDGKRVPRTLTDFLNECVRYYHEQYPDLGFEIRRYCQNLINEAILFSVGFDQDQDLPYNERFISFHFSEELAAYGSYEFAAFGFPEMRKRFKDSVLPIIVKEECKDETNGTCFIVKKPRSKTAIPRIVTALHCLPQGAIVSIPNWNPAANHLKSIRTFGEYDPAPPFRHREKGVDLAVLEFDKDPFPDASKFWVWTGQVLHDVLSIGFPPMKGFESVLVAGTGEIIGVEHSITHKQPYLIVSTRVKGGNSGGPILNTLGKVVGVVTNMLTETEDKPDVLGYGLATPAPALFDLLKACDEDSSDLFSVPFEEVEGGIRIRRR